MSLPLGKDGRIVLPIRSPIAADCIIDRYVQEADWSPNLRSVTKAIRCREAMGHVGYKDTLPVFLRVAGYGERIANAIPSPTRIVIDIHNFRGDVIVIDRDGWKIEGGWDYCMLRHAHMRALPAPPQTNPQPPFNKVTAESQDAAQTQQILSRFRALLNPATTKDFHRMLIWLLSAARGSGPVPILAVEGPTASGKTTATHFLRQAIDPSHGPHADHTARNRDLFEYANRNWVVAFEGVRKLTPRVTDFINSLAGGVTYHVKQRHDPHDPAAVFLQRPIIMSLQPSTDGKDPLAEHGDSLPLRTLRAKLAPISDDQRLGADKLSEEFKELQPQLLALLCTAVSAALKNIAEVDPAHLPALADAALWAIAAAPVLGLTEEEILAAFETDPAPDQPPEQPRDPVKFLDPLLSGRDNWTGSATELHNALPTNATPSTPKLLAQQLRRCTKQLAAAGLEIDFPRTNVKRLITIKRTNRNSPPEPTPHHSTTESTLHQSSVEGPVGRTPSSARVPPDPPLTSDAKPPIPSSPTTAHSLALTTSRSSRPSTISHKVKSQRHHRHRRTSFLVCNSHRRRTASQKNP